MRIKKHSNKNEYYLTPQGLWIRNPSLKAKSIDINNLVTESDYQNYLKNESRNSQLTLAVVEDNFDLSNCVIVSDGYNFDQLQMLLPSLPNDIFVLATNKSLAKWQQQKRIFGYVVNNPYADVMGFMPKHRYFPTCISSVRTYPEFIAKYLKYNSRIYKYYPTPQDSFMGLGKTNNTLDDYRNPISAAISLAFRSKVRKLLLFCCDASFAEDRPGSEKLDNGLHQYPQQNIVHGVIDGQLYWLKNQDIEVADCSSGRQYQNAAYIQPEEIKKFFGYG